MLPKRCGAWPSLLAALAGFAPRSAAAQTQAPRDSIVHLATDGSVGRGKVIRTVVRDSATFARLWHEVVGGPPPEVDFSRYFVIAVTLGVGGIWDKIRVVAIDSTQSPLRVRTELTIFCGPQPEQVSFPADIVRVPRIGGIVIFADQARLVDCN